MPIVVPAWATGLGPGNYTILVDFHFLASELTLHTFLSLTFIPEPLQNRSNCLINQSPHATFDPYSHTTPNYLYSPGLAKSWLQVQL